MYWVDCRHVCVSLSLVDGLWSAPIVVASLVDSPKSTPVMVILVVVAPVVVVVGLVAALGVLE